MNEVLFTSGAQGEARGLQAPESGMLVKGLGFRV